MIALPSGEKFGSVSMDELDASRCGCPLPSALIRFICEPPSFESTTASRRPSGDHAGALLLPKKLATACRAPVTIDCTYTTGLRCSNDTYASRVPSGDHVGEIMG